MKAQLEIRKGDFKATAICTGPQLETIFSLVQRARPDFKWFSADVDAVFLPDDSALIQKPAFTATLHLRPVPANHSLIEASKHVDQFLSGVFVAYESEHYIVPDTKVCQEDMVPLFDDRDFIQIIAFDTTMIWIATNDWAILKAITDTFRTLFK
jgi:hypothetical protein